MLNSMTAGYCNLIWHWKVTMRTVKMTLLAPLGVCKRDFRLSDWHVDFWHLT